MTTPFQADFAGADGNSLFPETGIAFGAFWPFDAPRMHDDTCLILIPHGSRTEEGLAPFHKLAADLRAELGPEAVYLCFMDIAAPSLMDVARQVMQTRVRKCRVLPLFLARGSHVEKDIPAQAAAAKAAFPELTFDVLEPIGLHPEFLELLRRVIAQL